MDVRPGCMFPFDQPPAAFRAPSFDDMTLVISLGDIKQLRVDRLATFVENATSSIPAALNIVGKCTLVIDGYNDDPRDLTQITEVRAYFQRVGTDVPLLPYLLHPSRASTLFYLALVGDGRRAMDAYRPVGNVSQTPVSTTFSEGSLMLQACHSYITSLNRWLEVHGLLNQTSHPLYRAHERSAVSFAEVLESSAPLVKPV